MANYKPKQMYVKEETNNQHEHMKHSQQNQQQNHYQECINCENNVVIMNVVITDELHVYEYCL